LEQPAARLEIRRNFFSRRAVDAWNMVPQWDKKNGKNSEKWHIKHREDMVEKAKKIDQKRRQASGGTISGTGHFLRDPTHMGHSLDVDPQVYPSK
jgi:hypothetical protein